jgi:hypothetical protein
VRLKKYKIRKDRRVGKPNRTTAGTVRIPAQMLDATTRPAMITTPSPPDVPWFGSFATANPIATGIQSSPIPVIGNTETIALPSLGKKFISISYSIIA